MSAAEALLERLDGVRPSGPSRWTARCPAHDDRKPSLTVEQAEDRALVKCHAGDGCPVEEIVAAAGLPGGVSALFDGYPLDGQRGLGEIVATYPYVDEHEELLFEAVRFTPKGFRQRRPDGDGGWTWKLDQTRRVLYRLPRVLEAVKRGEDVMVVEGERDVHELERLGVVATCNPGGAGKWRDEFTETLRGAKVTVVADRDEPGRKHARRVAESLRGVAAHVSVVEPRTGNDIADHLTAGGTLAELVEEGASADATRTGDPCRDDPCEDPVFALGLDDFLAARSEVPPALIGDEEDVLLPAAGFLILGGRGGKGKTTLMVDAAFHLASGRDWLGFKVPRPLRVLIIENEGPQEMFRRKLEAKAAAWFHEIRGAIFVHTFDWGGLDMRDKEQRRRLREHIAEYRIDLVSGDPLDSCGLEGVGSPEDTRAFMALAQEVGLHRTVAFCFLHHVRKERTDDDVEALSGAWGGRPDTVLVLSALAGQRSRLAVPKVRWSRRGKRPALILGFDPEIEGFDFRRGGGGGTGLRGRDRGAAQRQHVAHRRRDRCAERAQEGGGQGAQGARHRRKQDDHQKTLEGNPERFVRKPGDEVGRHANAQVWGLT
jgi:5S rRNA maturation endonuclease (ribonuclease M5)